jgi:hypothetical protein
MQTKMRQKTELRKEKFCNYLFTSKTVTVLLIPEQHKLRNI